VPETSVRGLLSAALPDELTRHEARPLNALWIGEIQIAVRHRFHGYGL